MTWWPAWWGWWRRGSRRCWCPGPPATGPSSSSFCPSSKPSSRSSMSSSGSAASSATVSSSSLLLGMSGPRSLWCCPCCYKVCRPCCCQVCHASCCQVGLVLAAVRYVCPCCARYMSSLLLSDITVFLLSGKYSTVVYRPYCCQVLYIQYISSSLLSYMSFLPGILSYLLLGTTSSLLLGMSTCCQVCRPCCWRVI